MTTKEQRDEFEKAVYDWKSHDEWQFADTEACWKFMFNAGRASVIDSQQAELASLRGMVPVEAIRRAAAVAGNEGFHEEEYEIEQFLAALPPASGEGEK